MVTATLIIAALLLLNALFVAAEFAIVGVPRTALERRARGGEGLAGRVLRVIEQPRRQDRYIATAQLGITVASLGLGMYGEHVLANWAARHLELRGITGMVSAHTLASAFAVSLLTYLHIVLGEMVPKSLALQQAERTALWVAPIMLWIERVCYPLIALLNALGNLTLRAMGVRRQETVDLHYSPEELELIVRESEASGMLRAESGRILRELFDFGELTAREVMTPRVRLAGLPLGADAAVVTETASARPFSRYPVYVEDLDHPIGIVHVKTLVELKRSDALLEASHVRPIPFVPETASLGTVIDVLGRDEAHAAFVIDEHGGTAGLATLSDLFEEVVGEIAEGANERPSITRDFAGRLHVRGTVRVEEVGEQLGVVLEHPDVDSVSGLVLTLLGRPPRVGDVVEFDHVRFEVTAVEGHGVSECLVRAI
jgi:CBS domain containing-hemolysin-like protein